MAEKTLNARLLHCVKSSADWESSNVVLKKGELGIEMIGSGDDVTYKIKIGDNSHSWKELDYTVDAVFTPNEKTKLSNIQEVFTSEEKTKLSDISVKSVSYEGNLSTGTLLGTITIDEKEYKIYGGGQDTVTQLKYSTGNDVNLSTNFQTGNVILGEAATKQVETTPVKDSGKLVTSGGVKSYVDNAIEDLELQAASKKGVDESIANNSTSTNLPTSAAVAAAINAGVNAGIAANDAMVYKGTIAGTSSSPGSFTVAADRGHTYKVSAAGYVNGVKVEIGDMFICLTDNTAAATSSNYTNVQKNWNVIQTNLDGAVIGPANATALSVAVFGDTSGKVIKDSGFTIGKSVPADAKFSDTTYSDASQSEAGLMSAKDKQNLDSLVSNAITTSTLFNELGKSDNQNALFSLLEGILNNVILDGNF